MMKNLLHFLLLIMLFPGFAAAQQSRRPVVSVASYFDISPPLRSLADAPLKKSDQSWKEGVIKNYFRPAAHQRQVSRKNDTVIQQHQGLKAGDTLMQNFDGLPNISFVVPPDPCGAVGPNHYFQMVNFVSAVYDKTGTRLLGPFNSGLIWLGMPHNASNGDGIVLYDENADRWLISQLALPDYPNGPFYEMIAVSQTPDPTGSWYRWEFTFNDITDYPKFGIWHDAYYMSYNRIRTGGMVYDGTGAAAFDRTAMISGDAQARMILFLQNSAADAYSLIPADCSGIFPDTATPGYFFFIQRNYLGVMEFHADWNTPANSTFGNYIRIPVSPFLNNIESIPQKATASALNPINDRLMFRAQFRNFKEWQSLVVNHTVDVGNTTGIRWYELRRTTGNWYIHQQSTYAPDSSFRWMGSMAIDEAGNMALGYSVASANLFPSVRYAGRMAFDPLNQLTIAERTIIPGGGAQTGVWSSGGRWGDYSCMVADPSVPQTFWYTQEYYDSTSVSYWKTRIASFSFSGVLTMHATANPPVVCPGGSVNLDITASGGTDNYHYQWSSIQAGFVSTLKSPVVIPVQSTKYIATLTDGSAILTDTLDVTTLPLPYLFPGHDTGYCHYTDRIPLQGKASGVTSTSWTTLGDGYFTDETSLNTLYFPGINDKTAALVTLKLLGIPQAPCQQASATVHIEFIPCAGIGDQEPINPTIAVFPNPSQGAFDILLRNFPNAASIVEIINSRGETVFSETVNYQDPQQVTRISLPGFASGIYILKVKTSDRVMIERVVLQ